MADKLAPIAGTGGDNLMRKLRDMGDGSFSEIFTPALPAAGQANYPIGATPLTSSSGNVANAAAVATLAGAAGVTTYISGFEVSGGGATAAALVSVTVAGLIGGTATYTAGVVAGAAAPNQPLFVVFNPPIPASALNTAIVVTVPALGAGNTNSTVVAHGFRV